MTTAPTGGVKAPPSGALKPENLDAHRLAEHNLTLHPPVDPHVGQLMDIIRGSAKNLAHDIIDAVPEGHERARALEAVEDACQHAIAGVARNQTTIMRRIDPTGGGQIHRERPDVEHVQNPRAWERPPVDGVDHAALVDRATAAGQRTRAEFDV